jgi:Clp amino terminal domain, pathogenicity island component
MENAPRLDDLITVIKQRPDDSPLDQLAAAVMLGEHLGELADHLIGHFVDQARRSGASWTEIGASMGVTKQAAQKRFVPKEPGGTMASDLRTFARYTDRARKAIVQAQEEARGSGQDHIAPEHLVLGLLHEPDTAATRAVVALDVSPDAIREALVSQFAPPGETASGHIPFAPQSKKVLELTAREALRLRHDHIGTEHLLLGVLSLGEGTTVSTLERLTVTKDRAERQIALLDHAD